MQDQSTQPVLSLRGIVKTFPGVRALDGVQIDLYPGQVTALIGENGAGKSTIVKTLTGIYQPDEGQIFVDGVETRFPPRRRRVMPASPRSIRKPCSSTN